MHLLKRLQNVRRLSITWLKVNLPLLSIKDALVRAYEEAEYFEPSLNDGVGGKAYDEENARINALTPLNVQNQIIGLSKK